MSFFDPNNVITDCDKRQGFVGLKIITNIFNFKNKNEVETSLVEKLYKHMT